MGYICRCHRRLCERHECERSTSVNLDGTIISPATTQDRKREFFQLCVPTKCGIGEWIVLMTKHLQHHTSYKVPFSVGYCGKGCDAFAEAAAFSPANVAPGHRFLFVRNPYERLLSAYLDEVARRNENWKHMVGLTIGFLQPDRHHLVWNTSTTSFDRFARALIARAAQNRSVGYSFANDHLLPLMHPVTQSQSPRSCLTDKFRRGGRIEEHFHVLKVEEMQSWYPWVVRILGLNATVSDNRLWPAAGCFWKAPGQSCSEATREAPPPSPVPAPIPVPVPLLVAAQNQRRCNDVVDKGHFTHACTKLLQYYSPELADLVTIWAHRDLDTFGYPPWRPSLETPAPLSSFPGAQWKHPPRTRLQNSALQSRPGPT